ncbi:MAG: hydrogenase iron-sulfur subunit [Candidatus Latescibacteria bacterium]|nr:hydrogenase iron-sulfur subunit [Candidatus Latescibacterota bacterium]
MNCHPLKIYIFCCSTSIDTEELTRSINENSTEELKVISLPCSGKVDVLYLLKAFETGADGVIIITCAQGECRYIEGNLRARKRAQAVDTLLQEIGYNQGLITVIRLQDKGLQQVIDNIEVFRTKLVDMLHNGVRQPVNS